MEKIFIVPEPKRLEFMGKWLEFKGFENFPEFLSQEFHIPKGSLRIRKIEKKGNGIEIKEDEVIIWGDENIAYATILQLLMQNPNKLPKVIIEEEFSFKFRGYHLDIARGGVPHLREFKRILKWLFILKYNYFAIYFEDLFPWKKYPEIGALRGRLTEEEIREIINYGRRLNIEVFPSLELCGHMENILVLPNFMKFSEWHRPDEGCIDVSNDEARKFTYELLEEVINFFPSKYVHIGGDETWALGRGRSLDKEGIFKGPELFEMYHRNLIYKVKESGKIPMVWGDMLTGMYLREEEKERWRIVLESNIWDETVIANWDYTHLPQDHFQNKINMFGKRKEKELACPGLSNWNRFYPNFDIALTNITNFLIPARKEKLLGFLLTSWGDDGAECLYSFLDPLILATMEIAEGNGNWEEKWLALKREDKEVLEVRKTLGQNDIAETIKHVFLGDQIYRYATEILKDKERKSTGDFWADYYLGITSLLSNKEKLKDKYEEVLNAVSHVNLPEDLSLIRDMLKISLNRVKGRLKFSDFISFGNKYAELWLSERKKENLEKVINKIYGAGGRADLEIY
ncbi:MULTISPECIES: beta-N-acetylhexosaminidase [Dictyoglomus]|uniref:beta-N-acetylhexosaminidase n=1 Tax=Dictyoglomus turgidum (strain DSM 6724 / Z-1310) TaxID=515635 RepID=B8E1M6_DICTD|nr:MULTISPECIES: beta-N-acetylhexosaminidase [Dictyoglomus]ACK41551.1 Glycoside hydrolase, family 20, catalytic core [Dictyoglomus turgidum DSM 6724]HBU31733.1 beta-N-acetylhexosaminidase [Dictyoglomus sp.]